MMTVCLSYLKLCKVNSIQAIWTYIALIQWINQIECIFQHGSSLILNWDREENETNFLSEAC